MIQTINRDIFKTSEQTITIPVNTVGVMGKGLAGRTKHQFPDVYEEYQWACHSKELSIGKPFLYKRKGERYIPYFAPWFLLFPTKGHWKNPSKIEYIERGLLWLKKNYKGLGITSLAVPALGCGEGKLKWEDVEPIIVKELNKLDIPVKIYLWR